MTYINNIILTDAKGILGNEGKYNYFSWFLIGVPSDDIMEAKEFDKTKSYSFDNGAFTFKDYNVAAYTSFISKEKMIVSTPQNQNVNYKFSGTAPNSENGNSPVTFTIKAEQDTSTNGYKEKLVLCLCTVKDGIEPADLNDIILGQGGLFQTTQNSELKIYTKYNNIPENNNDDVLFRNYISDVIVAFDVSSGENYVNSYNFSGFVVGDTTVTINGLYSNV